MTNSKIKIRTGIVVDIIYNFFISAHERVVDNRYPTSYFVCFPFSRSIHLHLSIDYLQGNSKEKLAVECATASLYAKGKTKKLTEENIKQYCADENIKWIPNLLFN